MYCLVFRILCTGRKAGTSWSTGSSIESLSRREGGRGRERGWRRGEEGEDRMRGYVEEKEDRENGEEVGRRKDEGGKSRGFQMASVFYQP